jgi:chromosome partitioning protein
VKTIALFNHKSRVGKTTLAYHLAWMMQHLGERVLAVDLDPQSELTTAFLDHREFEALWDRTPADTVYGEVKSLLAHPGELRDPILPNLADGLALLAGDLALWQFEDRLSEAWPRCLDRDPSSAADAFRITTAFSRIIARAAKQCAASIAIVDINPSLGALGRTALLAADFVIVPLLADLASLQGLQDLGAKLGEWRTAWAERKQAHAVSGHELPTGGIQPLGYVVLQHPATGFLPEGMSARLIQQLPDAFHASFLGDIAPEGDDPQRLAFLRHSHSLLRMAREARKPIFDLTAADGAIGVHAAMVGDAYDAYAALAKTIAARTDLGQ